MKKSLRPQIVAPVQRETTATSTSTGVGVVAQLFQLKTGAYQGTGVNIPFAGDDAE